MIQSYHITVTEVIIYIQILMHMPQKIIDSIYIFFHIIH